MNFSTSPAFVNISPPWAVRPCPFRTGVLPQDPPGTLGARGFRAVSRVFHACYGMAVSRRATGRRPARPVPGTVGDVAERRWAGSWLSGTPGRPETGGADTFPGQRFGLPEEGRG